MFSKAARSRAQAKVSLNDSASLHLKVRRQSFPLRSQRREKQAELTEAKVHFGPTGEACLLNRPSKLDHESENSSIQHNTKYLLTGKASSICRNMAAKGLKHFLL